MKHHILAVCILTVCMSLTSFAQTIVQDAMRYRESPSDSLRDAFNARYLSCRPGTSLVDEPHVFYPDSTYYGDNSLTDNLLPLAFGLVPEDCRTEVGKNLLLTLINRDKYKLRGLAPEAAPYLLPLLSRMGRGDVAYFLTQDHCDVHCSGQLPDSLVRSWEDHCLAGVNVSQDGRLTISPDFSIQELDTAAFCVSVPGGEVRQSWTNDLMTIDWQISIPQGLKADVTVPARRRRDVHHRRGMRLVSRDSCSSVWRMRGGEHHITVDMQLPRYVVERSFVYKPLEFPQCHAPGICETEDGDLLAVFYGGSGEGRPDVKIRLCRKQKGSRRWSVPVAVAEDPRPDYTTENPTLFRIPGKGEPILLFYKVGPGFESYGEDGVKLRRISFWRGCIKRSYDGGRSWSQADTLPEGMLGTSKNKPIWRDGRIIGPSGLEDTRGGGKHIQFEYSDDKGETWTLTKPEDVQIALPSMSRARGRVGTNATVTKSGLPYEEVARPLITLQPTILEHADGSLQALCRSDNGTMSTTWSYDNGATWTREVLTDIPQNRSGIDACTMSDGRFALVYTDFEALPGYGSPPRTPLKLAVSSDGLHWTNVLTLEDSPVRGYLYPAIIQGSDGCLHIIYNWRRYRMKYVKLKL